jgi:hypothetical protein
MAEQYTDFKRRHAGETIYVVGSGATPRLRSSRILQREDRRVH